MNYFKQFIIQFNSLSVGFHQYRFEITEKFFEKYEESEFKKGDIIIDLSLERKERMMILDFSIEGKIEVMCDRCLENFYMPINGSEHLIVKFGDKKVEENEEILIISESENELDLSSYLYEYICLLVPMRRIHSNNENNESSCDNEIIKKIEDLSSENKTDPRWEKLKNIKF